MSISNELSKSAPPVAITAGTYIPGLSINEWASLTASVLTAIYVLYQMYVLYTKQRRERQNERALAEKIARAEGDEDVSSS
jgi:predicted membrane protein